jgi:nitroreductase
MRWKSIRKERALHWLSNYQFSKENSMKIKELVSKNRSCRRFHQDVSIELETLNGFVDLARLSASGGNHQPLKYILSCDPKRNALVFPNLGWAAYLKDWPGPPEGERPSGYIIILGDKEIRESFGCDHGIAAQSILLGATEAGLGGCIIASIRKDGLRQVFDVPDRYDMLLVIALGKPKEQVEIEPVGSDGDIKYWRDDEGKHHVPKRSLDEIIVG